jgi:hypothetical protein
VGLLDGWVGGAVAEIVGRFNDTEAARSPGGSTWTLLYTADQNGMLSLLISNGTAGDAYVSVAVIPAADGWVDGAAAPPYSVIMKNIKLEADGTNGTIYTTPSFAVNSGDRVAVFTSLVGVTFYNHGIMGT